MDVKWCKIGFSKEINEKNSELIRVEEMYIGRVDELNNEIQNLFDNIKQKDQVIME